MTDTPILELVDGTGACTREGSPGDLRDLGARGVLDLVVGQRRAGDRAEADLLAGVVALVGLDPVTDPEDAACHPSNDDPGLAVFAALSTRVPLAGAGTPLASQETVAALGAALGISYRSALTLVGETLELCYRLPLLWALVQTGRLQAWKARRVARMTTWLSPAAVGFVDRHLAVSGIRNHVPGNLTALVTMALNRFEPEVAEGREEAASAARQVSFDYSTSTDNGATADLTARLDMLDALDLDHQITAMATAMGRLGDTDSLDVRRAHALGMLANPQHTLSIFGDLTTTLPTDTDSPLATDTDAETGLENSASVGLPDRAAAAGSTGWGGLAESAVRGGIGGRLHATGATLYLHITAIDLDAAMHPDYDDTGAEAGAGGCAGAGARVEKLNTITLRLLHDWLQRTDRVTIRPVLDPTRIDAVDQHDPPEWMRETVILRDQTCVFPGCTIDARSCDLDHIVPYQPMDEGGPPGQTSLANLACLCRRHHRMKTRRVWAYRRLPNDTYQWTSPHGHVYLTGDRPGRT